MAVKSKKTGKKQVKKRVIAKKKPHGSGKFAKGNTEGSKTKGKQPLHAKKMEFAELFKAAISPDDIKAIADKLVSQARAGNVKAAKEILDRCMGKPPQAVELTGAEGAPLAVQIVNYAGAAK